MSHVCYLIDLNKDDDTVDVRKVDELHHHQHHNKEEDYGKEESRHYHHDVDIRFEDEKPEEYMKYVAKHGHHFTKELAEYAVKKMNVSGELKYEKVEEIFKQSGESLTDGDTIYDLYYVANKIKARHSTATIKSDSHAVMLAIECLNDPSDGKVFCHWYNGIKKDMDTFHFTTFI